MRVSMRWLNEHPNVTLWGVVVVVMALLASSTGWVVFSDDDSHLLQLATRLDGFSHYYVPERYQLLSIVHFTPVAISLYQTILAWFGPHPEAFMGVQWLLCGLLVGSLAVSVRYRTQRLEAGVLFIALALLVLSMGPMLTRFYTLHYVFGGVCAALIALGLSQGTRPSWGRLAVGSALLALALLSKEIYLMLVPLLLAYGIRRRHWPLIAAVLLVTLAYMALRIDILGVSDEGRNGENFLTDLFEVTWPQWRHFLVWYGKTHALLFLASLWALWCAPKQFVIRLFWASWLVAPVLAAPHGFRWPELHADRLFFAFDLAWAGVIAWTLSAHWPSGRQGRFAVVALLVLAVGLQWYALTQRREDIVPSMAYQVTQSLLGLAQRAPVWVVVPPAYYWGAVTAPMQGVTATPDCQQGLAWADEHPDAWVALDTAGQSISKAQLAEQCQPFAVPPEVEVLQPVSFKQGVLSWRLKGPDGMQVGVVLPGHHMLIPAPEMYQRIVRPYPNEFYRVFARQGDHWWFSALRPIEGVSVPAETDSPGTSSTGQTHTESGAH